MNNELTFELSASGYWPAIAKGFLEKRQYSRAVELCTKNLREEPAVLSGRIVLALALYYSEQIEEAGEQFYRILQIDPDNIVALKHLGDIKFRSGDEHTAFSYYNRVLKLDQFTESLKCGLSGHSKKETKILTLARDGENFEKGHDRLRQIPFETETAGDLLLAQGHARMAREIFRNLLKVNNSPRLAEKLEKIESPQDEK